MNLQQIHPWNISLWQRLAGLRARLPHALLIQGRQGIGKLVLAEAFAASLLCESPSENGLACGQCGSCGWLMQGNHPDYRLIEPEDAADPEMAEGVAPEGKGRKKSYITVDQIRALGDNIGLSAHRQGYQMVLLHPAETLNQAAANALLKMLEEPPPSVVFLLVSHQPQRLLPTIRSRCHKITVDMPPRTTALDWLAGQGVKDAEFHLAQSGGSPLQALAASQDGQDAEQFVRMVSQSGRLDPFEVSARWGRADYATVLHLLQKWVYDLLAAKLSGGVRYYPAQSRLLHGLAAKADLAGLLEYQRNLAEASGQASHPLNAELQLEALLLKYTHLFA